MPSPRYKLLAFFLIHAIFLAQILRLQRVFAQERKLRPVLVTWLRVPRIKPDHQWRVAAPPAAQGGLLISGGRGCLGEGRLGLPGQVWELRFLPSSPSFPGEIALQNLSGQNAWEVPDILLPDIRGLLIIVTDGDDPFQENPATSAIGCMHGP